MAKLLPLDMFLVCRIIQCQSLISPLQFLNANFQLFIDSESRVIHFPKCCRLLCEILNTEDDAHYTNCAIIQDL